MQNEQKLSPRGVHTLAVVVLTAVFASGCLVGRGAWGSSWGAPEPVFAAQPPPAPISAVGPVGAGAPGHAWVDGHYDFRNGQYVWVNGHWERPPQPGWAWQQPAWHDNRWNPGFWHAPQAAVPPMYTHNGAWNPGWNARGGAVIATPAPSMGGVGVVGGAGPTYVAPARPMGGMAGAAVAVPVR